MLRRFYHRLLTELVPRRRDVTIFVASLLIAFFIWLGYNLSQTYFSVVSVPVKARSNIEGRAQLSSSGTVIAARVRISGFGLLSLRLSGEKEARIVDIDPSYFAPGKDDTFSINSAALNNYVSKIFGQDVGIESFVSPSYIFHFQRETHKKVPVKPVTIITFKPQYMATSEFVTNPDSVTVYGEPERLESINYIRTKTVSLDKLQSGAHGMVGLDTPKGMRLSVSEVGYNIDVVRYVEIRRSINVQIRNKPASRTLEVYPSNAEVVLKCVFPLVKDPFDELVLYIDYRDFTNSINGRCVAKTGGLTKDVISLKTEPEVFECIER